MKKEISPAIVGIVIAVIVVIVVIAGFMVWRQPSITAAEGVKTDAQGIPIQSPRAGGGPTADDFRKRDEWYRANPPGGGGQSGQSR